MTSPSIILRHALRVHAANKPLSYRVVEAVAAAGAMLHVEGLEESSMSKMTSRSAATMHDQQNHIIQRSCAVEALGRSPLHLQWDEGSKRKKAWVAASITGSRESGDGSRLREVLGAKALLPDKEDGGKKKSGMNVARGVLKLTLEFYYPDGCPDEPAPKKAYIELTNLHFINSDFTASNSGKNKGAATILRASIFRLSGHLLIFNAPCMSHVVHNECAYTLKSLGECERTPIARKKKKRDDDGILSALPELVPSLLDDLTEVCETTEGLMAYLADHEGVTQLRMPATGVRTRWGFYADAVQFYQPTLDGGRLDLIADFLISQSPKRKYEGDSLGDVCDEINQIESEDLRELLHELSKPRIRAALIVFELYAVGVPVDKEEPDDEAPELEGDNEAVRQEDVNMYSMRNFLHFTENDGEGVVFRYHRFVRRRLEYLSALEQADESDERLAMLYAYVEAHADAFEDTDVLALVRGVFKSAHKYFDEHTEFLFVHPVYLSFGMVDEHGDGVRTAKELVNLARGQEPMLVFPGTMPAPCVHSACTMHASCMHAPCMHHACIHHAYTMHAPCMHTPCMRTPCMHHACTMHAYTMHAYTIRCAHPM